MWLVRLCHRLLKENDRVTPAGACYLLREVDSPPVLSEAQDALDYLVRINLANRWADKGFGPEYSLKAKVSK
jgi:hypothetical protein